MNQVQENREISWFITDRVGLVTSTMSESETVLKMSSAGLETETR